MGIHQWWGWALSDNELPPELGGHLTNDQLTKLFLETHPNRVKAQPVRRFRSWFNTGEYAEARTTTEGVKAPRGTLPKVKSLNYSPAKPKTTKASAGEMAKSDSLHSSRREKLVEHLFVGEVLRTLWCRSVHEVDVLRAETDAAGYDIVIEVGSVARQIQLKSSARCAKTSRQKVHLALGQKVSGCVLWVKFDPTNMELGPFLWFGGTPGNRLPDITDKGLFPVAKHTKGNAEGVKAERKNIRVITSRHFTELKTLDEVIERLFGL